MCGGLYRRSNVWRLCLRRSKGGRGIVNIEDCVSDERKILVLHAFGSNENFLNASMAELRFQKSINVQNRPESRKQHLVEWKEKALLGQFLRKTESTDDGNRWEWLKRGGCNRETEILLCAAKEQAL